MRIGKVIPSDEKIIPSDEKNFSSDEIKNTLGVLKITLGVFENTFGLFENTFGECSATLRPLGQRINCSQKAQKPQKGNATLLPLGHADSAEIAEIGYAEE